MSAPSSPYFGSANGTPNSPRKPAGKSGNGGLLTLLMGKGGQAGQPPRTSSGEGAGFGGQSWGGCWSCWVGLSSRGVFLAPSVCQVSFNLEEGEKRWGGGRQAQVQHVVAGMLSWFSSTGCRHSQRVVLLLIVLLRCTHIHHSSCPPCQESPGVSCPLKPHINFNSTVHTHAFLTHTSLLLPSTPRRVGWRLVARRPRVRQWGRQRGQQPAPRRNVLVPQHRPRAAEGPLLLQRGAHRVLTGPPGAAGRVGV
jgi:hypothetical protein